jgi:hypothetical protein
MITKAKRPDEVSGRKKKKKKDRERGNREEEKLGGFKGLGGRRRK